MVSDFTDFYRHAVRESLSKVLGESASRSVLYHTGFDDTKSPKEFHQKLVLMIGDGASTLEKSIIKEMFASLCTQSPHEDADFDFGISMREARTIHARRAGSD